MIRMYHLGIGIRNKPAAVVLGTTAVIVGGMLVVIGLALVAGLVVAGGALGTGMLLRRSRMQEREEDPSSESSRIYPGLDPAQEVFPPPAEPPSTLGRGA